ncbi:MAG: GNAT family N-acetyltransferase [Bdellovibrionota bacterium]
MEFEGVIRETAATESKGEICNSILRSLPRWFGIEQAIVDYVKEVENLKTLVAEIDHQIAGFLSLQFHNPYTAEIHLIAVREPFHHRGIGRALILAAEACARNQGSEYFMVKTLGPSRPNPNYDRTRQFYLALGFRPLEELQGFWKGNPCLILVKRL